MSFDATLWGLKDAPAADTAERVILTIMGEAADEDGCTCYLAQSTIAGRALLSDRTVRRKLADMEARGVIARGDQRAVEHIPADQRPIVWDLQMPYSWFSNIQRINETRHTRGRAPLTPEDRPDLSGAPDPKKRADVGQPKPKPGRPVESDTEEGTGLQVRSSEADETDERTGLQVRPDSESRGTGLQVQRDRTSSPTTQSFTQSLNPQKPPADADATVIRFPVQQTIDGKGEELAPKAETDEDRAFGIARGWVEYRKGQHKPIAGRSPLHQIKMLVLQFIEAEYTDDEIKRALTGIAEGIPSKAQMQRALDTIRERRQPGANGRPTTRGAGARVNDHWENEERNTTTSPAPKTAAAVQTSGGFW